MRKRLGAFVVAFLLSIQIVFADVMGTLRDVWDQILYISGLGFLGIGPDVAVFAFLRLSVGILVFTIFFAVIKFLHDALKPPFSYFEKNQQLTVAFIMAFISAVFMPASVLAATGTVWGTVVSLILVGGPIFVIGYFMVTYNANPSRGNYVIKAVLALLLLWIISAIKFHVGNF